MAVLCGFRLSDCLLVYVGSRCWADPGCSLLMSVAACRFQDDSEACLGPVHVGSSVGDHGSQRCRQVIADEHPRWIQVTGITCCLKHKLTKSKLSKEELLGSSTVTLMICLILMHYTAPTFPALLTVVNSSLTSSLHHSYNPHLAFTSFCLPLGIL